MNIYADVTDEGLQPFYTYTLEEIAAQYEYDDNRMPIGKVYVQYDKDEYYLEDTTEVEDYDKLLAEDEVEAAIAEREAEDERQRKLEEMECLAKERQHEYEANHPIRFKLEKAFWWFVLVGFPVGLVILGSGAMLVCIMHDLLAPYFGWPLLFQVKGH